jgi:thiol reductant ABC exporter CydC subunit
MNTVARLCRPAAGRLALADLAGIGASACGIGLMAAAAWLIARAAQHPPVLHLTVAIVAVRAFGIGRAVLRYAERLAGHDAAFRLLGSVRTSAFTALERVAPAGLRDLRSGDVVSRFVSDMDAVMDLLTRVVLPYLVAAVVGVATAAFLAALLPAAGVVVLVGLLVVAAAVPTLQGATARRAESRIAPLRGELSAQVVELVHGAPDLLAYGAAPARLAELGHTDERLSRAALRSGSSVGVGSAVIAAAAGASVWAALALGTDAVRAGTLDGVLLAVLVLTPLAAFDAVSGLPAAASALAHVRASLRRVVDVIDRPPPAAETADPQPPPVAPYRLRLEGVTARWDPSAPDAVRDLDLELGPGERLALVGPSGCGKSTVAALLVRFLDPVCGRVTINGCDLRELSTEDVRRVVGLIADDAHIFDTTVAENLRIARPDATKEDMQSALESVRLLDWVDGLPAGLDTAVGERGGRLSGGQRRRLALARALLADFPVLVVDEPTEHLDDETATAIVADLLAAAANRTVLLITHRPHGLSAVDRVVRLEPPISAPPDGLDHGEGRERAR